ncbi:MAG: ABC transporter permease [Geminicoccaceae bacterium]
MVEHWGETLEQIFLPVVHLLTAIENFLLWLPWYVVLLIIMGMGFAATRSWKIAAGLGVMTFLLGFFGLWEPGMKTIALMLTATLLAVIIGIPLGIWMSRSDPVERITLPVLDIMQTMPIFVYLIPFVMLFGPGKIPALLATIVFAVPPVIRLTNLGIRQVDREVVEAFTAFGATRRQLLFGVQIPLALPTIMAGINQTTMMALSMVVIASMIGAGGLGYQVLQGIQRLEISRGLLAGLAIVFLAIIFDRIAQAYGKRMQQHLHLGH